MNNHSFRNRTGRNLPQYCSRVMLPVIACACLTVPAFAVRNPFTAAKTIIIDLYTQTAGISTVPAGLMSAVAVTGAKFFNNQRKVDQARDWLKRIAVEGEEIFRQGQETGRQGKFLSRKEVVSLPELIFQGFASGFTVWRRSVGMVSLRPLRT